MSTFVEQMPSNIVELTKIIEPFKEVFNELKSTMDDVQLSNLGVLSVELR